MILIRIQNKNDKNKIDKESKKTNLENIETIEDNQTGQIYQQSSIQANKQTKILFFKAISNLNIKSIILQSQRFTSKPPFC